MKTNILEKNINTLDNEFLTYDELADILKVSKFTLRNWMSQGKFKIGRDYIKLGNAKKSKVLFKKDIINRIDKILNI